MLRRYARGVRLLGQGLAAYARSPRLLLLGLIPAALTAVLFAAAFVALLLYLDTLASAVTWFAAGWPEGGRVAARVVAGVALLGIAALLAIITFTSVTLFIGDPFYQAIAQRMDADVPEPPAAGFWRGAGRSLADSLRLLAKTPLIGVPLFLAGLLPLVGQTVVPLLGAAAGGWMLALQLTGPAFDRRGLRLADRQRLLRDHRAESLGFGMAAFVCFLIPGGAVLVMPAAVAGGTLLARHVLAGAGGVTPADQAGS